MGVVSRFERRLQDAVGDVFARAFGGNVVPQEVEAALRREAADQVTDLDSHHRLAPNYYVITLNTADLQQLDADSDLTTRAFAKHLQDYIGDQGWQTYGDVKVKFESSIALHTGQFRTRGRVDPDVGGQRPPYRPGHLPTRAANPHQPSSNPQSGAGPMTQNSGYDRPGGHPGGYRDDRQQRSYREDYGEAQPGYGGGEQYQNGYGGGDYGQAVYDQGNYGYGEQHGYDQGGYGGQDYQQGYGDGGYAQAPGYDGEYAQGYDQGGYGQQGGYAPQAAPVRGGNSTATLELDDGSGRTYQLREGSNIIGRGQDAHFRLPDTGVSRRHIEVRWDGQTAMLSDLGSTNGTLVNGSPVQDWQLANGDVIRAGHSEILIRIV